MVVSPDLEPQDGTGSGPGAAACRSTAQSERQRRARERAVLSVLGWPGRLFATYRVLQICLLPSVYGVWSTEHARTNIAAGGLAQR